MNIANGDLYTGAFCSVTEWCFMCLQEEEEEQLEEEDSVKEETAEQEIANWTWERGHKHSSALWLHLQS